MNIYELRLVNGKGTSLIDKEDAEKVILFSWSLKPGRSTNYAQTKIDGKNVLLHRLILNAPNNKHIDHINCNGLDNRKSNLRFATRSQNRCNTSKVLSKYGFKGVYFHKDRTSNPWRAYITSNKKPKTIGYYPTKEAAAKAYDVAAKDMFGEFAKTNFKERE